MGRFHASPIFEKKYSRFKDTDFFKGLKSVKIEKALYLKSGEKISLFTGRNFIEPQAPGTQSCYRTVRSDSTKNHVLASGAKPAGQAPQSGTGWAVNALVNF